MKPTHRPAVHALQERALRAASERARRRTGNKRLSRSARLHLIDIVSRWGGSGLALLAGLGIFMAVSAGRVYPMRAAIWLLIMMAAVSVCRRLRNEFRAGEKIAAKPFRWRANYTSSLSVLSASFGAGLLILSPAGAPAASSLTLAAIVLAGAVGAGALHVAHGRSIVAILAPASGFVIAAVWRSHGAALAVFGAGALVAAASAALFLASRQLQQATAARFPRTRTIRRETDTGGDALPGFIPGGAQAELG